MHYRRGARFHQPTLAVDHSRVVATQAVWPFTGYVTGISALLAVVVWLAIRWERYACHRLLVLAVQCAERSGMRHWIDRVTLEEWMARGGDIWDLRWNHLSVVADGDDQWLRFESFMNAYGIEWVRPWALGYRRTSLCCTWWGGGVWIHSHGADNSMVIDETSHHCVPGWMIGVPKLQVWERLRVFIRTPEYPALVCSNLVVQN